MSARSCLTARAFSAIGESRQRRADAGKMKFESIESGLVLATDPEHVTRIVAGRKWLNDQDGANG